MTAAGRDPAELLVVLVDEAPRVIVDIADRHARQAIGVPQPGVARAGEDGVHGRRGETQRRPDPVWSPAPVDSQTEDLLDDVRWGQPRLNMRPAAPVLEPGPALGSIPAHPLVRGLTADTLGLGRLRDGPAVDLDTSDQELPSEDVEMRRTMSHESFLLVVSLNTHNLGAKLSFVNNLSGNHS
jgi:hypothetical protein